MDLKRLAEDSLAWIRSEAPGFEAEIYLARGIERGVEIREGALDGIQESSSEGAGLRVLEGGRMGFASAGGLSLEAVQALFRKVRAQLQHLEEDPHKGFPAPTAAPADAALASSLWDEELFTAPWGDVLPRLRAMEARALAVDKRLGAVIRAGYGESRGEMIVANTGGLLVAQRGTSASVGLSALSQEDGESQVGSAFQSACRAAELDFDKVADEAGFRTAALLGARKLPGGRRAVLFDPWVAGELLDLVSSLLCADQVQRGKSLLAGKLGRQVASEFVTFIDDPRRPGGLASSLYDDEGCPTGTKTMIEKGAVKEYFYDTYTARKDKRSGNASAGRGSFKGLPSPGCSNFYMAPGPQTREQLIADTKDGVLIDGRGSYSIDQQRYNGQFGGNCFWEIKNGKITRMVTDVTYNAITTDFWANLDAIGSQETWRMFGTGGDAKGQPTQTNSISHGSPYIRIKKIMVGAAYA